jgi:hypothetical protein
MLPSGKTIATPKDVKINGVNHSKQIFRKWSKEELATLGIKPFREERYHGAYYRSTGSSDATIDGEVVRTHTLENRYTGAELKTKFKVSAKQRLRFMWKKANDELEYLLAFDSGNTKDIDKWTYFKTELIEAFILAKAQLQLVTYYEDGVEFLETGFFALLPTMPGELDII